MNQDTGEFSAENLDIEHVIKQIKEGQGDQFQWLVKKYQTRIHLYCHRMLGNHHEAEEAVQEVFMKAYQHLDRYTRHISFSAWLYKIAYHYCINMLKRRNSWFQVLRFYQIQQSSASIHMHETSGPGTRLIGRLSPQDRNLILLRAIDECSYEEIAQIMNCKPSTVRKRYERAKRKLKMISEKKEPADETL